MIWQFYILSILIVNVLRQVNCVSFLLKPNSKKCLSEDLRSKVLVTGEYIVEDVARQYVDYKIIDSKNHILSQKDDIRSGKFSFITETDDVFQICFQSRANLNERSRNHVVVLFLKHGVQAKDYSGIADSAKLKPLEVEVTRLSDLTKSIVNTYEYMRKREENMRKTNETTNNRVFYFSIFSMLCLLSLATWQILYLRRYFKAKKLID